MAILRTNYRKTGGTLDVTAVGGHMMSTCAWGDSAGFRIADFPNGGFMFFSASGSIQAAEVTAGMIDGGSLAGVTRAWIDSTYGLMSRFNGNPVSGYRFFPVGFRFLSYSNVGVAAGDPSVPFAHIVGVSYLSGSCLLVSIAIEYAVSGMSVSLRGTAEFKGEVWGFIISAP